MIVFGIIAGLLIFIGLVEGVYRIGDKLGEIYAILREIKNK